MRVTIIGSGNVATVMGRKIRHAGHVIQQVYSRNADHAKHLAEQLDSSYAVSDIDSSADLYLVAISDNALHGIHAWLSLGDKLVVHTAGSVPMNVLKDVSANYGILYPLQTLRKELNTNTILPVLVDANNEYNRSQLFTFARSFADVVAYADDVHRSKLHLAALIANNFSNYLFTLAEEYCLKENVDFKMIIPLLEETAKRMNYASPAATQTGPAARKDLKTISKHLEMLADYPELRKLYEIFTAEIMSAYSAR
jgi:predicted short-subunit dehydrogenase-like oxidoreductase (DUF2520 family)